MRVLKLLLAVLAIAAFGSAEVLAQSKLPNRPIRLLVPFAPGGGVDVVSRVVGQKVSEQIGSSPLSFEDAAREVVGRANRTLRGITGIQVLEKRVKVEGDRVTWGPELSENNDESFAVDLAIAPQGSGARRALLVWDDVPLGPWTPCWRGASSFRACG